MSMQKFRWFFIVLSFWQGSAGATDILYPKIAAEFKLSLKEAIDFGFIPSIEPDVANLPPNNFVINYTKAQNKCAVLLANIKPFVNGEYIASFLMTKYEYKGDAYLGASINLDIVDSVDIEFFCEANKKYRVEIEIKAL